MKNTLEIKYNKEKTLIWCNVRKRFVAVRHEDLEEEVRQRTIIDIVNRYKYPLSYLGVEIPVKIRADERARSADIVIFEKDKKQKPFIVIENKRPERGSGADQAEKYALILGAQYAKYTDGISEETRRITFIQGESPEVIKISDIPSFGKEIKYLISSLQSFPNLKNILESCHNDLRRIGKDPVESFRIMSKIVIAKISDERNTPSNLYYEMQWGINESAEEVATRVRKLYEKSINILTSKNDGDVLEDRHIEIDDETLASIIKKLQCYSFIATPTDTKGTVFETFIDAAFRGPFGQYFTPRSIVSFMVKVADPQEGDVVIDPACGSGGFLIYILNHVRHLIEEKYKSRLKKDETGRKIFEFAQDNIFGIDIAALPEFAAKVNMLINDDGRGNIYRANALAPLVRLPIRITRRKYDLAITNPPFGIKIKDHELLSEFETGTDKDNKPKTSQDTKVLFIERCLQLISDNGRIMIVLPNGILNNPSNEYSEIRNFIKKKTIIKAVIRLPDDAFLHTGTGSRTSILYLQKKKRGDIQGSIFMAWVKNVGYDKQGHIKTKKGESIPNDLPTVFEKFRQWEKTGKCEQLHSPQVFIINAKDLKDSLDPRFYNPTLTSKINELKKRCKFVLLGSLILNLREKKFLLKEAKDSILNNEDFDTIDTQKVIKGKAPRFYQKNGVKIIKITEIKEINNFYQIDQKSCEFISEKAHQAAIQSKIYPEEILFAITGATIGKVVMVPQDIGEANICSDIAKIRIDKSKIDPYYIFSYLSSDLGQLQIRSRISGSTNEHLSPLAIENLEIPILTKSAQKKIAKNYKNIMEKIKNARKETEIGKNLTKSFLIKG